jgi:H+/Cl- antiporter ClcA
MSTPLLILFTAGIILFLVFILREARRLAGFLLAFGGLVVAGVVAYALAAQANATRQVARVAEVQAMTNAATTLTLFLLTLIVLLVLAIVGAVIAFRWWRKYQEQQRLAEAIRMLQMQALLNGQMPQPRVQGLPASFQASVPPVIVFPPYQPYQPWPIGGYWGVPSLPDPQQGWGWPSSEE